MKDFNINKKIKVLLIDDDEEERYALEKMLSQINTFEHIINYSLNYDDGLKKIELDEHDIYLIDYRLGKDNGIELIKEALKVNKNAPIILLTGYGDYEIDLAAMNAGASDYLNKNNINPELLERSIRYSIVQKKYLIEKEFLIQEMNHRVKNNFQLVSSMLNLCNSNIKDNSSKKLIKDCVNRILIMAKLHEKLYKSDNISQINLADYLKSIITDLKTSYNVDDSIDFNIKLQNIFVKPKLAVQFGLILNELISNSLKYAFPQDFKKNKCIKTKLIENNGIINLIISDNGIGITKDIDISKTLGMKIVEGIAKNQLKDIMTLNADEGVEYQISLKNLI